MHQFSATFLIFLLAVAIPKWGFTQHRCSAIESEATRRAKYHPEYKEADFERWVAQKIHERRNQLKAFGTQESGEPNKIAIVVHVIHNGEAYGTGVNIPDEQIFSQIAVLNEDYNRSNADTLKTQPEFLPVAGKMNVEFVLARQTEAGGFTNGIVRVQGPQNTYDITIADRELLSSISHWNPDIYLNMWVTDLRSPNIGLAQFPDFDYPGLENEPNRDNPATDGVIIDYRAFGSVEKEPDLDLLNLYNLGRTTTHELGHFFGLKHVWGDDTSPAGCSKDDFISDTPMSNRDYSGICVPANPVSCGSTDMFENYLYYTNDACMNIFTQEQIFRMETIIENAPRRFSLLNSRGTMFPGDTFIDIGITAILSPGKVQCEPVFEPQVEVINNGTEPIATFDILHSLDGNQTVYSYTGDTLFTGDKVVITLEELSLSPGAYRFRAELIPPPEDINASNNIRELSFAVDDTQDFIPLREGFDDAPDLASAGWLIINDDDGITWTLTTAPNETTSNKAAFINLYNYTSRGQTDWMISPNLDFSTATEASISFSHSYARNGNFNDVLYVIASENCGYTFDHTLAVFSSIDLAVRQSSDFWRPAGPADWGTKKVDLQPLAGKQDVRVAFMTINDFGNNLYLDDVEFFLTSPDRIVDVAQNSFTVYPNPSFRGDVSLAFNTSSRQTVQIRLFDQTGRQVYSTAYPNTLNQTYSFDLSFYPSGLYLITAQGVDFFQTRKLIINR